MALLVFKTSAGLKKVPGGFDSHPPPLRRGHSSIMAQVCFVIWCQGQMFREMKQSRLLTKRGYFAFLRKPRHPMTCS